MNNIKFVFVQNIIAPYRTFLYNSLFERGLNLIVFYQAETEISRNWKVNYADIRHPYWMDRYGMYLKIRKYHIHINPYMLIKMLRLPNDYNIQLSGWDNIDTLIMCLLKKFGIVKNRLSISCEANYLGINGPVENKGFKNLIKKFVMSSMDGYTIIPGEMAIHSLKFFGVKINKLNIVTLPNLIDEDKFFNKHIQKNNELPLFIMTIRLIEYYKGVLNFFDAIGDENILKCIFLIVGDGEDYYKYNSFIDKRKLKDHIHLLGFKTPEEVNDLYNRCDAMILPSFSDASPLSLIEATKVGLPILASNHCGNHFECVEPGRNGEIFDPCNKSEIKTTFELFLSSQKKWPNYSRRSEAIYKEKFASDIVLSSFIKQISGC